MKVTGMEPGSFAEGGDLCNVGELGEWSDALADRVPDALPPTGFR